MGMARLRVAGFLETEESVYICGSGCRNAYNRA